jgi:predicted nucleotidyltransferase component of viral defense system
MILKNEVLDFARAQGVEPRIVEKDYVLGWVLAGIHNHPELATQWIFKGGTCLKKCYFETYRFSEDLDFSVLTPDHINKEFLIRVFADVVAWVEDQAGIILPVEQIKFDVHPDASKKYVEGRLYYTGPMGQTGSLPKIILDITNNEVVVLPSQIREIYHPYSDQPAGGLKARCYGFEEVFAEKTRALAERARPRDLYDVIHLFRNQELVQDKSLIVSTLQQKCEFKNIAVPTLEAIQGHRFFNELHSEWENMLGHQLTILPPIESFLNDLPDFFDWLNEEILPLEEMEDEATLTNAALFIEKGTDTTWQLPPRLIAISPDTPFLEKIRFAAANRLCLDLAYNGERRIIEPYEVRRKIAGDLYLAAIRVDSGQNRSYTLNKIEDIKITHQVFQPRFPIPIGGTGQLIIGQNVSQARQRDNYGPKYIYRCTTCGKSFTKRSMDSTLRPHKNKHKRDCHGRYGTFVRTKYR